MGRRPLLALLLGLCLLGVNAQDGCTPLLVAAEEANLTTFVTLLEVAGLQDVLMEEGVNVTVFAPSDAAFQSTLDSFGLTLEDLESNFQLLTEILLYHVLPVSKTLAEFGTGGSEMTLLGEESTCEVNQIDVEVGDGTVTLKGGQTDAGLETVDLQTCTGVLHVIDFVLVPCPLPGTDESAPETPETPEDVEETPATAAPPTPAPPTPAPAAPTDATCTPFGDAAEDKGLNTFVAALQTADLLSFVSDPEGSLTIFAPTDEAFTRALESQGLTLDDLLANNQVLQEILLYHVLPSSFDREAFGDGIQTATLLGDNSSCNVGTVDVEAGDAVVINGGETSATVVELDVRTCSAVVHIIDNVLLPCPLSVSPTPALPSPSPSPSPPTPAPTPRPPAPSAPPVVEECTPLEEVAAENELDTFLAAVDLVGFMGTLADRNADLTIFAPTNEAFASAAEERGLTIQEIMANTELVKEILAYHVLPNRLDGDALSDGIMETLLGNSSSCDVSTLDVDVGVDVVIQGAESSATVQVFDVETCSGIVHIIDDVLFPCPLPGSQATPSPPREVPSPEEECKPFLEAAEDNGLDIFIGALEEAGLREFVSNRDVSLTVLAPTDAAFIEAVESVGITMSELTANRELLREVLLYHILPIPFSRASFGDGGEVETILQNSSTCGVSTLEVEGGGTVFIGGESMATVEQFDVDTCSGVMHIIDFVLFPCPLDSSGQPSPVPSPIAVDPTPTPASEECTPLVEAARDAGLNTALSGLELSGLRDVVTEDGVSLTMFAPTDEAFVRAFDSVGLTLNDIVDNRPLLEEILMYHILPDTYTAARLSSNAGEKETLLGSGSSCGVGTVDVQPGDPIVIAGGQTQASIVEADIQTCTAVVHVVDFVLLPCLVGEPTEPTITNRSAPPLTPPPPSPPRRTGSPAFRDPEIPPVITAANDRGLTTFANFVETAGLGQELSQGDLTVFAPTNGAFTNLGVDPHRVPREQVREILLYHVLRSAMRAADFNDGDMFNTALGSNSSCGVGDVAIAAADGDVVVVGDRNEARVIEADIEAGTSIIHAVDTVLLPCELQRFPPKRTAPRKPRGAYDVYKCIWSETYWRWICQKVTVFNHD